MTGNEIFCFFPIVSGVRINCMSKIQIREAAETDRATLLTVEREAFEGDETIVGLIEDLLIDETARPLLSLIAEADEKVLGHVLFTRVSVADTNIQASILAPLAVKPGFQKQGIGGKLIKAGLEELRDMGVELVFVLGWPEYYPRYGFQPSFPHVLVPPYPIEKKNEPAWMVQELREGVLGSVSGTISCADALDKPEYWVE